MDDPSLHSPDPEPASAVLIENPPLVRHLLGIMLRKGASTGPVGDFAPTAVDNRYVSLEEKLGLYDRVGLVPDAIHHGLTADFSRHLAAIFRADHIRPFLHW